MEVTSRRGSIRGESCVFYVNLRSMVASLIFDEHPYQPYEFCLEAASFDSQTKMHTNTNGQLVKAGVRWAVPNGHPVHIEYLLDSDDEHYIFRVTIASEQFQAGHRNQTSTFEGVPL